MLNYIEVFTGNFIEVQRIFNELGLLNVCAIIRDKSKIERFNRSTNSNQSIQEILVHKDELKRAQKIIKRLTSELQT
tara:strand:- start:677 stop:907 length:231 start_codon:yes stop_codon:yes gene_type:complete